MLCFIKVCLNKENTIKIAVKRVFSNEFIMLTLITNIGIGILFKEEKKLKIEILLLGTFIITKTIFYTSYI